MPIVIEGAWLWAEAPRMRRRKLEDDARLAVGPEAVPLLDPSGAGRWIEVPRELASNGCPGPLERRANGRIMVPIPAGPGPVRPASLSRTLASCGVLPAEISMPLGI